MNLNKVFVMGNLTRDPELRQIPTGQTVCSFSIATNRRFTDKAGQKQEQVEFHNIVAWGRQAEIINQYLHKGSSIFVEGRLQTRSWQDQQGTKHWKTEIVAEQIQLGPRPAGGGGNPQTGEWGGSGDAKAPASPRPPQEATPIIELPEDGEEIDVKDIPF